MERPVHENEGDNGVGRHELKYGINPADRAALRPRLRAVARYDENAGENGAYKVRSLYFDNYGDKAVIEKLSGQSRREKFRLRYYNDDPSFIRLEKKSKANRLTYKEGCIISMERCEALLRGEYEYLMVPDNPLFMELYAKMRFQNLRPRCIVDYDREAYVYRPGNTRITFDGNIRASGHFGAFLDAGLATIPAAAASSLVLEIKYDGFLPDIMRDVAQIGWRNQAEFSKYLAARLV